MFIALGPGGVSFSMQAIAVCEENTEWAARVISHMQEEGLETCDVKVEALKEAVGKNQRHADRTVWCVTRRSPLRSSSAFSHGLFCAEIDLLSL